MNLLIVESPGKIKKLKKILGIGWIIKASMGHFRTLAKDGEDNLGFDFINNEIKMRFQPKDAKSKKVIEDLKEAAKKASQVYVAIDPDREGEVIAWHIFEILKRENKNIVRVTFKEITASAVNYAIAHPRSLDLNLVGSGFARSCLDKAVGYKCSPLVWNLNAKSVGRVQSAVLHLICDREREILNFKPVDYFNVYTEYIEGFKAYFSHQGNKANDSASDESERESKRVYDEQEAKDLVTAARINTHIIKTIEQKQVSKKPPPPFITSSLHQAVGSKIGFSPDKTMKLAQSLYEKGLITYMRTDSVALSDEFCEAARNWLQSKDPQSVPQKTTKFKTNNNSQEAHEAIRPSDLNYPSIKLKQEVSEEEFKLYLLIWKRAIASQCARSSSDKTTVFIKSGDVTWKAKGNVVQFLGYAKYWNNLNANSQLPELTEGQTLKLNKADSEKKRTSPLPRYGEPQLVALMETKGIGRPSTYSSSVKTIKTRSYAKIAQKKLVPTELGITVDSFLNGSFPDLIDAEFTARMELNLDLIASGEKSWQPYLYQWNQTYFEPALMKAKLTIPQTLKAKANGTVTLSEYKCPVCKKPLERYDYIKEKQAKSLLRCSDSQASQKLNHRNAVFFLTRQGNWWNSEFGQLNPSNVTNCDRSSRKTPKIRSKPRSQ